MVTGVELPSREAVTGTRVGLDGSTGEV
jgi:hypothetical protein